MLDIIDRILVLLSAVLFAATIANSVCYFALIGEYTRKGMIVNMSIDNYVIPDINSKSDIVIGIWNDVISKSTNTENIGEAAEVQSVEVVNTVEAAPEVTFIADLDIIDFQLRDITNGR